MKQAVATIGGAAGQGQVRNALLFVSAGRSSRKAVLDRLALVGVPLSTAADPNQALRMLASQPVALAIVDLADDRPALAAIRAIVGRYPRVSVAAVIDVASTVSAAEAIHAGAFDLLPWPLDERDVLTALANARERALADGELSPTPGRGRGRLIAQSDAMRTLAARLDDAARARSVLIAGEPGSGRSHLARVLHARRGAALEQAGRTAAGAGDIAPFVVEDCADGGPGDLEVRLFGVSSATGQEGRNGKVTFERVGRLGAIYRARGGTLCLTHIADAPVRLQTRLSRLLRDREAELAEQPGTLIDLDQRLIVCADSDLDEAITDGRVRHELYDRIALVRIDVPPLRRRREDIPALAMALLLDATAESGERPRGISQAALKVLGALPWRGNIAELKSLITLLVRTGSRPVIDLDDVLEHASFDDTTVRLDVGVSLREAKARFERECIAATLARYEGRVSEAARALGIQRTNLYRKVRELQVVRPRPSARRRHG